MRPLLFCALALMTALVAHQQAQQALEGPPMPRYTLEARQ